MISVAPSIAAVRGTATTFHLLAIIATIFRLYHRQRLRRLWWDDYWALVSLVFNVIYLVALWLPDDGLTDPFTLRIMHYWLRAITPVLVVWTARLSLAMAVARLVLPKTRMRRALLALSGCFVLACCALLTQKVWICCRDKSWQYSTNGTCYLGDSAGIISLCTDIIADTCLVVIPLRMLWGVKLPKNQRRLILSLFSATIFSSVAGIAYAALILNSNVASDYKGSMIGLVGHIKASITLLICNLLVIVTYIYRVLWKSDDEEILSETTRTETRESDKPAVAPPTPVVFTSVSGIHTSERSRSFAYFAASDAFVELGKNRDISQGGSSV